MNDVDDGKLHMQVIAQFREQCRRISTGLSLHTVSLMCQDGGLGLLCHPPARSSHLCFGQPAFDGHMP